MNRRPRVLRTSSRRRWLSSLASAYRDRKDVTITDDAQLGIDPSTQSIWEMGRKDNLGLADWGGVLVSLGISVIGMRMIIAAILDPEPTSKLGLLISSGVLLALCGGFSAIQILTGLKPASVQVTRFGLKIGWD